MGKVTIVKFNKLCVLTVLFDHALKSIEDCLSLGTRTLPEVPIGTILMETVPVTGDQFCTFVGQSLAA